MSEIFQVRAGEFEGPLDLLLNLVEKRKLFVNDVSLTQVTEDYIRYLNEHTDSLEDRSTFIVVAATLLLLKSRSLLPDNKLTVEEEEDIEELGKRLVEYKKTTQVAEFLKGVFGKNVLFTQAKSTPRPQLFAPDETVTIGNIQEALFDILARRPQKEKKPEVSVKQVITLEEMINRLTKEIENNLAVSFNTFSKHNGRSVSKTERIEIVVGFLALLELLKRGVIEAEQPQVFGEIEIESQSVGTPNFSV